MNTTEIQTRLDSMVPRLLDKGMPEPGPSFTMGSSKSPSGMISWREAKNGYNYQWSHHKGDTVADILDSMDAWISALPTRDERKMDEFTTQLAATIELCRANGIDVEFVNPLIEAMKRLSENAIEDHSGG